MISIGGYTFRDEQNITKALTHSSYSADNYERLEYLGDSILDFLVGKHFFVDKTLNEGMLTKLRAHYVSEENLSKVFDKLNVENYVKLGKSCKVLTKSIKCDMFEAITASVYLDSNIDRCEQFIEENIYIQKVEDIEIIDNKSLLQEIAQKHGQKVEYVLLEKLGQSHNPTFVVEAKLGGLTARAESSSKQDAEQKSAKIILDQLGENQWILRK
mgnify:CR=1 FL=1